tara:strand:- start:2695 stop:2973 length:279 start_codon:yes stop_codon:yes gene_type:complete
MKFYLKHLEGNPREHGVSYIERMRMLAKEHKGKAFEFYPEPVYRNKRDFFRSKELPNFFKWHRSWLTLCLEDENGQLLLDFEEEEEEEEEEE